MAVSRDTHLTLPQDVADYYYARSRVTGKPMTALMAEPVIAFARQEIHVASVHRALSESNGSDWTRPEGESA